jgi:hypothetical protein
MTPLHVISGNVEPGGFIGPSLWQIILTAILATIGYGVKRIVDNLKTLTSTVNTLSVTLATTGVEVRFQGEQAEERYNTLVARTERIEDQQDDRRAQPARIETKLDTAIKVNGNK